MLKLALKHNNKGLLSPNMASRIERVKDQFTVRSMSEAMKKARESTPTGVSQGLVKSIQGDVNTFGKTTRMRVTWTAPYAASNNSGARPHWVPIRFLYAWAASKGLSPWAVQKSIAKKGTKKSNFLSKTETKVTTTIFRLFTALGSTLQKALGE